MASIFGKINVLGLGSGLDLQGLLDQLREVEEKPIERLEAKKEKLNLTYKEYDFLNTKVLEVKGKIRALSLESSYLERKASVAGDSVSASAGLGALTGKFKIEVNQLARYSMWQSTQGFASNTEPIINNDQELEIAVGDESFKVSVSANASLEEVARLINEAEDNPGVEAKVVNTGGWDAPYRLVLKAKEEGENARIVVTQPLAEIDFSETVGRPNIWRSGNYTDPSDSFSSQDVTLSLTVGAQDIEVNISAGTSLSEAVEAINTAAENSSLRAYLMKDTSGQYFIELRSPEEISLTQSESIFTEEENEGENLNAFLVVDGILYQRSSNTINDIIPGVTLSLQETGRSTVEVSNDFEGIEKQFKDFVEGIGNFFKELREKMAFDLETGEEGPLYGSSAAENLLRELKMALSETIDNPQGPTSLFDLGLNFKKDGSITFDEGKLRYWMSQNPEGVKKLLAGDEDHNLQGLATKINNVLDKYLGSNGSISIEQKGLENKLERLDQQISKAKERVDKYVDYLRMQFLMLDRYIQNLNDTSAYLEAQFKGISKSSEK